MAPKTLNMGNIQLKKSKFTKINKKEWELGHEPYSKNLPLYLHITL